MESMLYQGHRFLGGIKYFWMAVRTRKAKLVLEDLALQKRTKMWPKRGISWGLIEVWQSEWSVVCWIWIAKSSTVTLPSPWTNIWPKKIFQWFRSHHNRLIWVRVTSSFSPKLKFHLKGRHFGTVDNIQKVVIDQLRALPHEDFQHCYRDWEEIFRRCMSSQGNYFQGDNVDL